MQLHRSSGILLHPTSLPGPFGIGTLGREAEEFLDFLVAARQSVWQILPLGPTGYGDSPYSAYSAFAGNPLLICPRRLAEAGDLEAEDLENLDDGGTAVDYGRVHRQSQLLLEKGCRRFFAAADARRRQAFADFCTEQAYWLNDYAMFQALRRHFGGQPWYQWEVPLRRREEAALCHWGERLVTEIEREKYAQFIFFEQWFALREQAAHQGIHILGDMPIFVALDSADVWANTEEFQLDDDLQPTVVAGVPPDYFSASGQRWGNPLYRWQQMAENGFSWWVARLRWALAQTDMVRIDHFRGFDACWEIPAEEPTAVHGHWQPVPGEDLFRRFAEVFGEVPVVAEDLGLITPEVEALRDRFGLPGMKILQFAFGSGPENPYLPHNLPRHCVVYTGTHDNDTTLGWWRSLPADQQQAVRDYLGHDAPDMPWDLVRVALASVAELAIIPIQDLLGLDGRARMNCPGQASGNWGWRCPPGALTPALAERLERLIDCYGRHSGRL